MHLLAGRTGCANPQFLIYLSGIGIDDGDVEVFGNLQAQCRLSNRRRPCDDYQRFFQYSLADNASLGIFNKCADIIYLLRIGVFGARLGHTFLHNAMTIDNTVGIMDGLDGLVRETTATESDQVHTSVADRLFTSNHVGRNVLTGA